MTQNTNVGAEVSYQWETFPRSKLHFRLLQVGQAIAIFLSLIVLVVLALTLGKYWLKELTKRAKKWMEKCRKKPREVTPTQAFVEVEGGAKADTDSPLPGELTWEFLMRRIYSNTATLSPPASVQIWCLVCKNLPDASLISCVNVIIIDYKIHSV